ncbi:MAG: hypothetical protein IT439_08205 [Phycisphaerales bacterium]|nr:hypothetical protein [Phycisphaerales bacterium]
MKTHGIRQARTFTGASLLALVSAAGGAIAQEIQPLLVIERAALKDWTVDPRDSGLAKALGMVPARLRELPEEIPGFPAEAMPLVDLGINALANPGRMAITYNVDNPEAGFFGYGVAFSVQAGSKANAERMQGTILGLLDEVQRQRGEELPLGESQKFQGMKSILTPIGSVDFGPREVGGTWWYDIAAGAVVDPEQGFDALPAPVPGIKPFIRGRFDFEGLNPALKLARGFADEQMREAEPIVKELENAGLLGEDAIKIDFQAGYDAEFSRGHMRVVGARRTMEYLGLPTDTLSERDLRAVPANAVMASVARYDLEYVDRLIERAGEWGVPVEDMLGEFKEHTGVDLRADVIQAIGGTVIAYMSDETGGGGLASTVVLMSYRDRARFLGAHDKLMNLANEMLEKEAPEAARYMRLSRWSHEGTDLVSLRFFGVPVPLEITYAATNDWLVVGMTPQAVLAAVRQATGKGDQGLVGHPALRGFGQNSFASVSIMDSARLARDGYPFVSMIGSAISAGVRSPGGGDRDPGLIVPTYSELVRGMKPSVTVSYWQGDDYISETRSDRSLLAQGAASMGMMSKFAPVFLGMALAGTRAPGAARPFGLGDIEWPSFAESARALRTFAFVDPIERTALMGLLSGELSGASWRRRAE